MMMDVMMIVMMHFDLSFMFLQATTAHYSLFPKAALVVSQCHEPVLMRHLTAALI